MSYVALYRKWRPLVFEDIVEQEHVVKTLKHSVKSNRIAHAYLFCGTRGTGKTTMAHILSRAINCLNPKEGDPCNQCEICRDILSGTLLDVIEIDAASNNSVDNIRDIRDEIIYAPSRAKYKVYIIDEVHMLSTGAFNALLKTLEEPPQHAIFILATTEPQKLPATVLSRCQRFDFRRISIDSIMERLSRIALDNNLILHESASRLIARLSDGALRDAISLLDQCISTGDTEISHSLVMSVVGIATDTFISDVVDTIIINDVSQMLNLLNKLVLDGMDIPQFVSDLIYYYRNLLVCMVSEEPDNIIYASAESISLMKKQAQNYNIDEVSNIIRELSSLEGRFKWATYPRILLEVSLVKLCKGFGQVYSQENDADSRISKDNSDYKNNILLERIIALEKRIETETSKPVEAIKPVEKSVTETVAKQSISKQPISKQPISTIEGWDELIKELRNMGRMTLYSYILDTKALQLKDNIVGIVFPPGGSFQKEMVNTIDNLKILQELLTKDAGKQIRVKLLDQDSLKDEEFKDIEDKSDEFLEKTHMLSEKLNISLDKINIIDE